MSDPSLVQITFKIKPEMPKDMKQLILACFTNYYTKYYPDKIKYHTLRELGEKYPAIWNLEHNDFYHNVSFQVCQLDEYDLYDLDTLEILHDDGHWLDDNDNPIPNPTPSIGVSIISLPKHPEIVDEFFKLVGPYITSEVCTLGIQHFYDYGKTVAYYYIDDKGYIKKHIIKISKKDETLWEDQ